MNINYCHQHPNKAHKLIQSSSPNIALEIDMVVIDLHMMTNLDVPNPKKEILVKRVR